MSKNIIIWGAVVVGIGLLIWGLAVLGSSDSGSDSSSNASIAEVSDDDHVKGNPDAETVLVEYGDFQCPACASAAPLLTQLEDELGDNLAIVFRHFPLTVHPNAPEAAQAAEAAGKQDKFFEMHDLLFARQDAWSASNEVETIFESYAEELGLNIDQYREDFASEETEERINRDLRDGRRADVSSTPTFYLNGEKLTVASYDEFLDTVRGVVGASTTSNTDDATEQAPAGAQTEGN